MAQLTLAICAILCATCVGQSTIQGGATVQDGSMNLEDEVQQQKGLPRPIQLPKNFDQVVSRDMQNGNGGKPKRYLHGDPSPLAESVGRARGARLFWPFSIEITKGGHGDDHKGGWSGSSADHYQSLQEEHQHHPNPPNRWWGFKFFKSFKEKGITFKAASTPDHAHHQDHNAHGDDGYTTWATGGTTFPNLLTPGLGLGHDDLFLDPSIWPYNQTPEKGKDKKGEKKGLSDKEIMNTKHYKRYMKFKHKKIKHIKRFLKFKRMFQKILQKHIIKADKVVPY